jgi:hypothetical protein
VSATRQHVVAVVGVPLYPLATTRAETLAVVAWLVDTGVCDDRREAFDTVLGADCNLAIAAYHAWLSERHDEQHPPCLYAD